MPILYTVCTICENYFNNSEGVYGTTCGHLFHETCNRDWRQIYCPLCRKYYRRYFRVYVDFGEENVETSEIEYDLENIEIAVKLETSNEKTYEVANDIRTVEANIMHLQGQYTDLAEYIKKLEDRINQLLIENDCKSKELKLKKKEIESLKSGANQKKRLNDGNKFDTDNAVGILPPKNLSSLSSLLSGCETATVQSTRSSDSPIKLCWDYGYRFSTDNAGRLLEQKDLTLSSFYETTTDDTDFESLENQSVSRNPIKNLEKQIDSDTRVTVFIKNIPVNQIIQPLENVVVNLALKMELYISTDDLAKTILVENNDQGTSNGLLCVVFKSKNIKDEFFSKKFMLKNNPTTKYIIICEFLNEELHSVFKYAETKLRESGFEIIYCKANKIFSKRNKKDRPIYIGKRKQEVDKFLKSICSPK